MSLITEIGKPFFYLFILFIIFSYNYSLRMQLTSDLSFSISKCFNFRNNLPSLKLLQFNSLDIVIYLLPIMFIPFGEAIYIGNTEFSSTIVNTEYSLLFFAITLVAMSFSDKRNKKNFSLISRETFVFSGLFYLIMFLLAHFLIFKSVSIIDSVGHFEVFFEVLSWQKMVAFKALQFIILFVLYTYFSGNLLLYIDHKDSAVKKSLRTIYWAIMFTFICFNGYKFSFDVHPQLLKYVGGVYIIQTSVLLTKVVIVSSILTFLESRLAYSSILGGPSLAQMKVCHIIVMASLFILLLMGYYYGV